MLGLGLGLSETEGVRGLKALLGPALLGLWDAERPESLALSGSSVASWTDLARGHVMAQSLAAARPTWSASALAGRPGLVFDGVDDMLEMTGAPFPTGAQPCEIWAVADQTAPASDTASRALLFYGDASTNRRGLMRFSLSGVNRLGVQAGDGTAAQTTTHNGADFSGVHVARGVFTGTQQRSELDGSAGVTGTVVPATVSTRTRIGALPGSPASAPWKGVIGLVLVTQLLSSTQSMRLSNSLQPRIR